MRFLPAEGNLSSIEVLHTRRGFPATKLVLLAIGRVLVFEVLTD
jgi:hypothetical protein